jgi:very-short-patch-repair endonuclease
VVEADGFEHHGTRVGLRADCARHTRYALHGWTSLRFSYEDAMYASDWVVWVFRSWLTGEITAPPDHPEAA